MVRLRHHDSSHFTSGRTAKSEGWHSARSEARSEAIGGAAREQDGGSSGQAGGGYKSAKPQHSHPYAPHNPQRSQLQMQQRDTTPDHTSGRHAQWRLVRHDEASLQVEAWASIDRQLGLWRRS